MRDTLRELIRRTLAEGGGRRARFRAMQREDEIREMLIPLYLELMELNATAARLPDGPEFDEIMARISELENRISLVQGDLPMV